MDRRVSAEWSADINVWLVKHVQTRSGAPSLLNHSSGYADYVHMDRCRAPVEVQRYATVTTLPVSRANVFNVVFRQASVNLA